MKLRSALWLGFVRWRAIALGPLLSCATQLVHGQPAIAPAPAVMKPDWSITIQVPVRLANFDPRAASYLPIECTITSEQARSAKAYAPLSGGSFNGTVDVRVDMGSARNLDKATSFLCILHSYSPIPKDGLPQDIAKFDKTKPLNTSVIGLIPRAN
jgi:hypothetical protein